MHEVVAPGPETEADSMALSEHHEQESAEIIDFSRASNELVMGVFFDNLHEVIDRGKSGLELAVYIEAELSPTQDEEVDPLKARVLRLLESADALGDNDLYDHKVDHDPVFHRLVDVLQSTREQQRSLREHRRAALKLTNLRAAIPEDETRHDGQWHDVIDRLFT